MLFCSLGDNAGEMLKRKLPPYGGGATQWLVFDELVVGSGHAGEYVSETSLAATQSFPHLPPDEDVLLEFRERLYKAHGVLPPQRRTTSLRSDQDGNLPSALKVLITDNEKYSPELVQVLQDAARELNASTQLTLLADVDSPRRRRLPPLRGAAAPPPRRRRDR